MAKMGRDGWYANVAVEGLGRLDPPGGARSRPTRRSRYGSRRGRGGRGDSILGVATAWACQEAGLGRILLLEADCLGSGATGGAAGLLVPAAHAGTDPVGLVVLAQAGLAGWRRLEAEVPGGVGLVETDWLGLAPFPPAWEPRADAEALTGGEVARIVPGLNRPRPGVLVTGQGRLDPLAATAQLASRLAQVATGVAVTGARITSGRLVELTTTAGPVRPGAVMFCTGGPPELAGLGLRLPATTVRGHLLATAPVALRLPAIVAPVATQVDGGRLLAGGTLDADADPELDSGVVQAIRGDLDAALPAITGVATVHAWCCLRPAHPDRLPVVDRVPGIENAWLTSGHYRTGILLAPAVAAALATWVTTGKQPNEVRGFEATRSTLTP